MDNENDKCEQCFNACNAKRFQQNFDNWTSGNNDIDKLIQDTQLSAHYNVFDAIEWIPYNRFYNTKYISESKFGKVYRANWIDGRILCWDCSDQNWKRSDCNTFVILKSLNNPKNITLEYMNKVFKFITYQNFLILLIIYYVYL
jgi:hypothetical protein